MLPAAIAAALLAALVAVPAASGGTYLPKKNKIFHGLTFSGQQEDTRLFERQTRSHPAVSDYYVTWGDGIQEALKSWDELRVRGMLTITASRGHGQPGLISPRQITRGRGDAWLLQINRNLANWGDPVYANLFPEMNGYWNSYAAFNKDGSRRPGNSTKRFKSAWKRATLIIRGGKTNKINRKLRRARMPKINKKGSRYKRVPRKLPRPKIAMVWIPQSHGSPLKRGNGPEAYWPGKRYVDWVGADTFSKFSNFPGINSIRTKFAKRYRKPMMLGEYASWDSDAAGWIKEVHAWAKRHARMLIYYQGFGEQGNPFKLDRYPKTRKALRKVLNRSYFQKFAGGAHTRKRGKGTVQVTTTRGGRPVGGFAVCRVENAAAAKPKKRSCSPIRNHGTGILRRVPEGQWYLRIRRPGGLGPCWERPDKKSEVRVCGRVRVKTGKLTRVRWPLRPVPTP